ncbi:MAG TPA: peroxide stress protein YaaA, partial [Bacteroidetes bacterium]|nr:peroxide stress protein YaaA [Bacteroidota bacterium]
KVISFLAKKARGMMTRFIAENKIENSQNIKSFDLGGYSYSETMSKEKEWVFIRG